MKDNEEKTFMFKDKKLSSRTKWLAVGVALSFLLVAFSSVFAGNVIFTESGDGSRGLVTSSYDMTSYDGVFDFGNGSLISRTKNFSDTIGSADHWMLLTDFDDEDDFDSNWAVYDGSACLSSENYSGFDDDYSMQMNVSAGDTCQMQGIGFGDVLNGVHVGGLLFRFNLKMDYTDRSSWLHRICTSDVSPPGGDLFKYTVSTSDFSTDWVTITLDIGGVDGNPDYEGIIKYFMIQFGSSSEAYTVYIDNLQFAIPMFNNGLISFRLDDRDNSHYDMFKLMKKYGYAGVEACVPSWDDGLSVSELQEMQEYGWDIVNHGYEHDVQSGHTYDEIRTDLLLGKQWLIENGFNGYDFYVGPGNQYDYYNLTQIYQNGFWSDTTGSGNLPLVSPTHVSITSDLSLEDAKSYVDESKGGKWVIFLIHGLDGSGYSPWTSENFSALLDYIYDEGVPVKTFSQIEKMLSSYSKTVTSGEKILEGDADGTTTFKVYHYLKGKPVSVDITPTNQTMANCTFWISDKTNDYFNITIYESVDWSALDDGEEVTFDWVTKL